METPPQPSVSLPVSNCPETPGPLSCLTRPERGWQVPSGRVRADGTSVVRSWDCHGRGWPCPLPSLAGIVFLRDKPGVYISPRPGDSCCSGKRWEATALSTPGSEEGALSDAALLSVGGASRATARAVWALVPGVRRATRMCGELYKGPLRPAPCDACTYTTVSLKGKPHTETRL